MLFGVYIFEVGREDGLIAGCLICSCSCVFFGVIMGKWALVSELYYLFYFSRVPSYCSCFVSFEKRKRKYQKINKSEKNTKQFIIFCILFC